MQPLLLTLLGAAYFPTLVVLPFYLWRDLPRSHPTTIKRRIAASCATCLVAWVPTRLAAAPQVRQAAQPPAAPRCTPWSTATRFGKRIQTPEPHPVQAGAARPSLPALLGLRAAGLGAAATLPLALTALLFAGPLYMLALDWRAGVPPASRVPAGPAALRNLVAAPLTEELIFRGGLLSFLLARGLAPGAAAALSPLAFGAAHLHHLHNLVAWEGWPLRRALPAVLFQAAYTTAFGWYAAYLLLRTGSLASPVIVHAFCNFMGFPAFAAIPRYPRPLRVALAFALGIAGFALLLRPLTEPALYGWAQGKDYAGLFRGLGSQVRLT